MPRNAKKPRRRLAFWLRTYLATLALFLACLLGVVFGVATVSRNMSFSARCEEFLNRQHLLVQSMAEDIAAVAASRPAALPDLYAYYGGRYGSEGVRIAVWQGGSLVDSSQPKLSTRSELSILQPGQRTWQVRVLDGRHVIFATTMLSGELSDYTISACADIEDFYAEWRQMSLVFSGVTAAVSLLFAVGLFLVLHRMYRPIKSLTTTAAALAGGDFSARADAARRDELGDLARTLNDMAGQVAAQLAQLADEAGAKQLLVDNLSHEMRTPLTAIGGYAEYIQRAELTPDELLEATDTIRFESRRLLNLSNQLVKLSVMAHEPPAFVPLLPGPLLSRAEAAVLPKAAARGVTVSLLPPTPESGQNAAFCGDADLLESLLVNLADNGIKACERGGSVTLSAAAVPGGGCVFTVQDTGHGMTPEMLAHIGQPFYRADKARSRAEGGAGLGAALCMSIARAHGATLTYQSLPGKGTAATVVFPAPPCE